MAFNPISLVNLEKGRAARAKKPVRVNVSLKPSTHERLKKLPLNVSASIDRIVEWVATAGKVEEIFLDKSKDTHNRIELTESGTDIQDTHNRIEEVKLENIQDTHNRIEEVKLENIQDTHNRIEEVKLENIQSTHDRIEEAKLEDIQSTHNRIKELESENQALKAELDLVKSKTDLQMPEAATLLNQIKSKNRKSKITLQDIEAILETIPEQSPELPDLYAARDKLFQMPSLGGWTFEKGEKRDRFYAFAEALIAEASKLNPNYTIIDRLLSDLRQATARNEGYSAALMEKHDLIRQQEIQLGQRKFR